MCQRMVALAPQVELFGPVRCQAGPDAVEVTWVAVSVLEETCRCCGATRGPERPAVRLIRAAVEAARDEVVRLVGLGAPPLSWRVYVYHEGHLVSDCHLVRVLAVRSELRAAIW